MNPARAQKPNVPDAAPEPSPRRWWTYAGRRRVRCPAGHHLPVTWRINETGFIRCNHWIDTQKRECGRWVFLFAVRGGGVFVVEAPLEEHEDIAEIQNPHGMLEYFGIFTPDHHEAA